MKIKNILIDRAWDVSFILLLLLTILILLLAELFSNNSIKTIAVAGIIINWISYSYTSLTEHVIVKHIYFVLACITLLLFVGYALLRLLNVYDLQRFSFINSYCTNNPSICTLFSSLFFKLKIYRFITLSTSFFLSFLFLFSGLLWLTDFDKTLRKYLTEYKKQPFVALAAILLSVLFLRDTLTISDKIFDLSIKAWQSKQLTFYDRFVPYESGIEHGGWIWEYGKFINSHVPEKSVIFVPPQSDIWPQEGNIYYFRWFIYPRNMVQSLDATAAIPTEADYILISRGGWHGAAAGWPKHMPKTECINQAFLIDRKTVVTEEVLPLELDNKLTADKWGVIKLNKDKNTICL